MKRQGFTLLELMIAVALLSVIILLTASAARLGYRSIELGERKMDSTERERAFHSLLDAQIESLAPLTYIDDGTPASYFKGTRDSLTFASNYSLWGGERGFVVVTYRVATEGNRPVLYVAEHTIGIQNTAETMVIDGLDQIYFEYAQKGATDEKPSWMDVATTGMGAAIPDRIRVSLVKGHRLSSFIIPVRVTGSTAPVPVSASDGATGGTSS